jgi:hypothetical protein
MSNKVLMYTFPTPGISVGFGRPIVSLKGFEKIVDKDNKRLHELMDEIKHECQKLEVHFEAKIYETADIKHDFINLNTPL